MVFGLGEMAVVLDLSRINEKSGALKNLFVRGCLACNLFFAQSKAEFMGHGEIPLWPPMS